MWCVSRLGRDASNISENWLADSQARSASFGKGQKTLRSRLCGSFQRRRHFWGRVFLWVTSQNKSRRNITLELSAFFMSFNYLSAYNTFRSLGLMYRTCNILLLEQLLARCVSGDNIQFPIGTTKNIFPWRATSGTLKMGFADHHQYYSHLSSTNNTWMMFLSSFQHRIIQKVSEFRIKRRLIK